jgi:hypothetical protein
VKDQIELVISQFVGESLAHLSRSARGPLILILFREPVRILLDTVAEIGDRQLVAGNETACRDTSAVDPRAVGAAQVIHVHSVLDLGDAAVEARDPKRVEAGIAPRVAAHRHWDMIPYGDVWPTVESNQSCRHDSNPGKGLVPALGSGREADREAR